MWKTKSKVLMILSLFILMISVSIQGQANNAGCGCDDKCSWNGLYLSGQLGEGWKRSHAEYTGPNYFNTIGPVLLGNDFYFKSQGFVGGGALGYNFQYDNFVVGLETGALYTHLKRVQNSPFFATDVYTHHLRYIADAKLRLGYAHECFLGFITGGWAGGKSHLRLEDPFFEIVATNNKWINGWTAGGGVDYKLAKNFSLGIAYDFIQLSHKNTTTSCPLCGTAPNLATPIYNHKIRLQTVTFRINYHI